MNENSVQQIRKLVGLAPIFAVGALLFYAYDYYTFENDPTSPMLRKQAELGRLQKENKRLEGKVKAAQLFFKSLDAKRAQIRTLARELDSMRGVIDDKIDIPNFIRMAVREAKKVGLVVSSIKPIKKKDDEFYVEQPFEMSFRGVYVQLLVFLDRISKVKRIIRVSDIKMKPIRSSQSRYVELQGAVTLNIYRYLSSKADEIARKGGK